MNRVTPEGRSKENHMMKVGRTRLISSTTNKVEGIYIYIYLWWLSTEGRHIKLMKSIQKFANIFIFHII